MIMAVRKAAYMPLNASVLHICTVTLIMLMELKVVKDILSVLTDMNVNPKNILDGTTAFFGRDLSDEDTTLKELMSAEPADKDMLSEMYVSCLFTVIIVLECQYKHYFEMDITEHLCNEIFLARTQKIDAEEIMGMFSAGKERAKNVNVDFLVSRMRSHKNMVMPWLDDMYQDKRESIVIWVIGRARKKGR